MTDLLEIAPLHENNIAFLVSTLVACKATHYIRHVTFGISLYVHVWHVLTEAFTTAAIVSQAVGKRRN